MSYGDEQAESRRLHSILKEGSMTAPRTEAGLALLDDLAYTRDNYLDSVLAIEAEAAALCSVCGVQVANPGMSRQDAERAAALTPGALDERDLARVIESIGATRPWLLHRAEGEPSEGVPLAAELIVRLSAGQAEEEG